MASPATTRKIPTNGVTQLCSPTWSSDDRERGKKFIERGCGKLAPADNSFLRHRVGRRSLRVILAVVSASIAFVVSYATAACEERSLRLRRRIRRRRRRRGLRLSLFRARPPFTLHRALHRRPVISDSSQIERT